MASVDDRQLGIARLYARAMLQVAEEQGQADDLLEEITGLAAHAAADPDFLGFLASPLIDEAARRDALERLFRGRASDLLVDSLQVIHRKGRLGLLAAIAEAYRQAHRDLRGEVDVYVTSAVALGEEERKRLQEAADRFTGRRACLVETVDPGILGGLVIRVADDKIDASVANRVAKVAQALTARASEEILSGKTYFLEPGTDEVGT